MSVFSRAYKQASSYFLTRQLLDCYRCLEPMVRPSSNADIRDQSSISVASISAAPRITRVKIWNLYLTLVNAIIELGPEEGKAQFGIVEWKEFVAKARDGTIWDEVVQTGYAGHEGHVDAEIVANLITLLLAQSPNQVYNQQKIEQYLAALSQPNLDISSRLEAMNSSTASFLRPSQSGANTPRDLNCRVKILELFSLHVLPRNDEWQYAKEFISMSEVLDEDRKEAFLQTLQALREQNQADKEEESLMRRTNTQELERQRLAAEITKQSDSPGFQEQHSRSSSVPATNTSRQDDRTPDIEPQVPASLKSSLRTSPNSTKLSVNRPAPKPRITPHQASQKGMGGLFQTARSLVKYLIEYVSGNPTLLTRTLLFIIALLMALARKDVRVRLNQIRRGTWNKVRQTIGMGVKVSYI